MRFGGHLLQHLVVEDGRDKERGMERGRWRGESKEER